MATLRDAVFGQAVGDALGVPYEFRARDSFTCSGHERGANPRHARGNVVGRYQHGAGALRFLPRAGAR